MPGFGFSIPDVAAFRRGGAPAFSPAALFAAAEPGVWYDPSDAATVFTDTAGTVPAAVDDLIARINDKSGRGFHATQPTLDRRPVLRADGALRYLEFDGVDDAMFTASITPGANKTQVITGLRKTNDTGTQILAEMGNNDTGAFFASAPRGGLRFDFATRGSSSFITTGTVSDAFLGPITSVYTAIGDISGPVARLRLDGTFISENLTSQGTGDYLARVLRIGARGGTSLHFNGRIYSLIVRFGANLTTDQIAAVEGWTAQKSGVTL